MPHSALQSKNSAAGSRGAGRLHQRTEKRLGKRVAGHTLRVPLNPHDPMLAWLVLDGFDHAIRRYGGNAQTVTEVAHRLMMRAVYVQRKPIVASLEAASASELGDFAALLDPSRMDWVISFGWQALAAVDDIRMEFAGNVLIKRAAETHVEALAPIADGEDGLTSGKSMFQDSEVGPLAISVGVVGLLLARRVVQRGVDISRCARENKSVQVRDLGGKLGRR